MMYDEGSGVVLQGAVQCDGFLRSHRSRGWGNVWFHKNLELNVRRAKISGFIYMNCGLTKCAFFKFHTNLELIFVVLRFQVSFR